ATSRSAAVVGSACAYRLPPIRKIVSAPYRPIQCGTRAASIPPAGTGKEGDTGPSRPRSRALIAAHDASENVNRPPALGYITPSLPATRNRSPNNTSGEMPWAGWKKAPASDGCDMIASPVAAAIAFTAPSPAGSALTTTPRQPAARATPARSNIPTGPLVTFGKYSAFPPASSLARATASWQRSTRSRNGAVV